MNQKPTLEEIGYSINILKLAGLLPRTTKNGRLLTHEEVGESLFGKPKRKEGKKRRPRKILTPQEIAQSYALHKGGMSGVKLAKRFSVSQGQMSRRLREAALK